MYREIVNNISSSDSYRFTVWPYLTKIRRRSGYWDGVQIKAHFFLQTLWMELTVLVTCINRSHVLLSARSERKSDLPLAANHERLIFVSVIIWFDSSVGGLLSEMWELLQSGSHTDPVMSLSKPLIALHSILFSGPIEWRFLSHIP